MCHEVLPQRRCGLPAHCFRNLIDAFVRLLQSPLGRQQPQMRYPLVWCGAGLPAELPRKRAGRHRCAGR